MEIAKIGPTFEKYVLLNASAISPGEVRLASFTLFHAFTDVSLKERPSIKLLIIFQASLGFLF